MQHQAVQVRLYPTTEQQEILSQHFGCSRWWWNHAVNLCIETYKSNQAQKENKRFHRYWTFE